MKRKRDDEEAWRNGFYMMSAINKALGGRKAKYIDEPLLETISNQVEDEDMTESQKKRERDALLTKLQIMQANFELNHSVEDGGQGE